LSGLEKTALSALSRRQVEKPIHHRSGPLSPNGSHGKGTMIRAIQRRLATGQDQNRAGGFTLIEIMVVICVVAILVGIAIPAFLGSLRRAQDSASRSSLRNALGTAQTIFIDNQAYLATAAMVTTLGTEEPSLTFQNDTTASTAAKQMSLATSASTAGGTLDTIILASKSGSGTCWYFRHVVTAEVAASGTFYATTGGGTACQASNAPAAAASWSAV
jgi:prepilin-type N-terminal cleavage/methylation domain-containing protein